MYIIFSLVHIIALKHASKSDFSTYNCIDVSSTTTVLISHMLLVRRVEGSAVS